MQYNFAPFKKKVADTTEWLSNELSGIHTGRATPAILDHVSIESYGSRMAVPHVAGITIEDARTLRVSPWDKAQVKDIEKAVYDANLGLSVSVDSDGLRIIFPELTTERRTQFVKIVRAKLEDSRIALRTEREKISSDITEQEREGNMSEDEKFRAKDELQKLVDEGNAKLEAVADKKETEIMG
ncbi:MAG: ribosome recycling factor [Candidatus Yonathbacteria bacterium RIFOXYC1_FULL_52_10]|uniref:Ribosome recycling factor n=1 Tax=Candidatus Yonathbacteria bacterium RIFOXYD1_FULL_52_36 TaxID=1802730 RepID=A0A1G2SK94_9BACT|nr:MAG: ribosome recycling factor [Candidatus Yonathbacteria bacterium RIFOXYC1_FULL_52_10]OHA85487.1 MAG: ribosome recycling factor [Candidatus Yonathbacteria bacterium RIFOXYD1_FULL_52_36]